MAFYLKDAVSNEKQPREFSWKGKKVNNINYYKKTNEGNGWSGKSFPKVNNIPFCSFDILDITTGMLCSAPPWGGNTITRRPRNTPRQLDCQRVPVSDSCNLSLTRKWSITLVRTKSEAVGTGGTNEMGSKLPWCSGRTLRLSASWSLPSFPGRDSVGSGKWVLRSERHVGGGGGLLLSELKCNHN